MRAISLALANPCAEVPSRPTRYTLSRSLRDDGRLPTAAEVAAAAGLAKGTVYLYFKTKEEIFANVLLEGWLPILQATELVFKRSKGKRLDQAHAFIASIVDHLGKHPELLRLDTLSAGVLGKYDTGGSGRI
jgi:hypothetical protein